MKRTLVASLLAALACSKPSSNETARDPAPAQPPASQPAPDEATDDTAHRVVFADRISQSYLLLLPGKTPPEITRESLAALARSQLTDAEIKPELDLLTKLISTPPPTGALTEEQRRQDLLGLHLEIHPIVEGDAHLVDPQMWMDPILVRELDPADRASLPARRHVLVLRAEYRNQYALRGLRLLQTLVQLAAREHGALIFDPDTGETMNVAAFERRKLRSSRSNIADQIAVVPFADERHGDGFVRLTTRGMRRFGSVDLELDGLPRDRDVLQAATHLLYGLAYTMMHLGEYDERGYAVELGETVTLPREAVNAAYGQDRAALAPCSGCLEEIDLHLVERPAEPHDPHDHVVARVVAPRTRSDASGYDHRAWVNEMLDKLIGASGA